MILSCDANRAAPSKIEEHVGVCVNADHVVQLPVLVQVYRCEQGDTLYHPNSTHTLCHYWVAVNDVHGGQQ